MTQGAWRPLLVGAPAEVAWEAILAIASELAELPLDGPSLYGGASGCALLFAMLDQVRPGQRHDVVAERLLGAALEEGALLPLLSLARGLPGIALVAELTAGPPDADAADAVHDPHDDLDRILIGALERRAWAEYDLITGIVGIGVYALHRLYRPTGRRVLELVVAELSRVAEHTSTGTAFFTPVETLEAQRRRYQPDDPPVRSGHYNLGLAHGLPGVVALLARILDSGHVPPGTAELLATTMDFMMAHGDPVLGFDKYIRLDGSEPAGEARSAWCYGNPGAAIAMLGAGVAAGRDDWRAYAVRLLRRETVRPVERCYVRDGGLCHGSFGLAHIYNRAYQAAGDDAFADAARRWASHGLMNRRPGHGIAGFAPYSEGLTAAQIAQREAGLLAGAAGIALALLALVADVVPIWDACLLTDVPPCGSGSRDLRHAGR